MHLGKTVVWMFASASLSLATTAVAQQSQGGDYSGVSKPPSESIDASPDPAPVIRKPSAGVLATPPAQVQAQTQVQTPAAQTYVPQPTSAGPVGPVDDPDSRPIENPPPSVAQPEPELSRRAAAADAIPDPDGDIVQPRVARPGELLPGVTIRVKLLDRLSSYQSERGEDFHGQVAYDVLQDGKVLIPAGSSIEGKVTSASSGHFAGHGSLRLRPDAVILPDGTRFRMHAETTGTTGTKTRMGSEGAINPGSRLKKDGVEYGAVVGTGAVAGAVIAGPVGALTGSLVGAGLVTTHLMMDHPQATLEPGSVLLFTLTEPMNLTSTN